MSREEAIKRIIERLDKQAWCVDEDDIKALCIVIPELSMVTLKNNKRNQ